MKLKNILLLLMTATASGIRPMAKAKVIPNGTAVPARPISPSLTSEAEHFNFNSMFKLRNPYSDAGLDIAEISLPTIKDCDVIQSGTDTITERNGEASSRSRFHLCLRRMSDPDPTYFKKAVREAASAFLVGSPRGDLTEFNNILYSWPQRDRKKLHDEAVALAHKNGATATSTMPASSNDYIPRDEIELLQMQPHHSYEIKLRDEEEFIENEQRASKNHRPRI